MRKPNPVLLALLQTDPELAAGTTYLRRLVDIIERGDYAFTLNTGSAEPKSFVSAVLHPMRTNVESLGVIPADRRIIGNGSDVFAALTALFAKAGAPGGPLSKDW